MDKVLSDDFSAFFDSSISEMPLERLIDDNLTQEDLEQVTGLLLNRVLHLLREASTTAILEECMDLNRFIESTVGQSVKSQRPDYFGRWAGIAELLSEAAQRVDAAAVSSILLAHKGYGQKILEILAAATTSLPRSQIRKHLEISESHLSHILSDLDEASLIVRRRLDNSREVTIDLGPLGREIVDRSIFPSWISVVIDHIKRLPRVDSVEAIDPDTLRKDFLMKGAPSDLLAKQLADAIVDCRQSIIPLFENVVTPNEVLVKTLVKIEAQICQNLQETEKLTQQFENIPEERATLTAVNLVHDRELTPASLTQAVFPPVKVSELKGKFRIGEILSDAIFSILPALAIASLVAFILQRNLDVIPAMTREVVVSDKTILLIAASMTLIAAILSYFLFGFGKVRSISQTASRFSVANMFKKYYFRHSFGALIGGLLIGILVSVYFIIDSKDQVQSVSYALTEDRLVQVAFLSMQSRQTSGTFLESVPEVPPVFIEPSKISDTRAVYTAKTSGLPGEFIAELATEKGNLWFEYPDNKRIRRASFLVGIVQEISTQRLRLLSADGEIIDLQTHSQLKDIKKGDSVIVKLNPTKNTADLIQQIK